MLDSFRLFKNKGLKRAALERLAHERLTEPIHLNLAAVFAMLFGSFRTKVAFDLIFKEPYAWGVLRAADHAKGSGIHAITVIEVGVAAGAGLLSLCDIAKRTSKITGLQVNVVGFDRGKGMPPPCDYRDHPDSYQAGDYPMDEVALRNVLPDGCELIIGEIEKTIPPFLARIEAPIGFVAIDVDYYSSASQAMSLFVADPTKYVPLPMVYFDDIWHENHHPWAGELLALKEFNEQHVHRKLELNRFLRSRRFFKNARWIDQIYGLYILDHPDKIRTRSRDKRILGNPFSREMSLALDKN